MRSFLPIFLIILLALPLMGQEEGVPVGVKRSTDKVKIEGKYYYIHIVRKGETLYSISRAYNVSQIEIAMDNPDIYLGLQVDQALKIPITDKAFESPDEDDKYIYHVVRKQETLFGLSRKYNIPMQDIIAVNPEVEEGLIINQVVLIPKSQLETLGDSSPEKSERFIYHEVQPREGFYALTREYGISEETIKTFNEDLVRDGIKLGTILRIPRDPNDTILKREPLPASVEKTFRDGLVDEYVPDVVCDTFDYNPNRHVYNIALLLPFYDSIIKDEVEGDIEQDESTNQENTEQSNDKEITQQTANFLDFYQGFLLAIDGLKQQGLSINLSVFNTSKNADMAKELTQEEGLRNAHLIIGPAYPECLKPVAEFALENRIPLVSPLSSNSFMLDRNPYLFQVNPSFLTQLEEFTQKIDLCSGQNIVLVHEGDSTNINLIDTFKEMIGNRISHCPMPEMIHFKEVSYKPGRPATEVQERISHSLVHERENLVLVPSNDEAFVSDLLGTLQALTTAHKYQVNLYGLPRWQRFRSVHIDYYYQLQLNLFTPFFVDYSRGNVKSFITQYRDEFRSEPSHFAYRGYDVAYYFLSAMMKYGVDFQFCIHDFEIDLLQSNYRFRQVNSISGYENRSIYSIRYNQNYQIFKYDDFPVTERVKPVQYIDEPGADRKEGVIVQ